MRGDALEAAQPVLEAADVGVDVLDVIAAVGTFAGTCIDKPASWVIGSPVRQGWLEHANMIEDQMTSRREFLGTIPAAGAAFAIGGAFMTVRAARYALSGTSAMGQLLTQPE